MNNHGRISVAKTAMLIRHPISEVFNAFIDPAITTKFWFTKSTGKLEEGEQIEWTWEMYNYTAAVVVKRIEINKSIIIEWENYTNLTQVEWVFESLGPEQTYVCIVNSGFQGSQEQLISQIADSTKGFTFLLAGLKAYLEHGIQLNLVQDAFPKGLQR